MNEPNPRYFLHHGNVHHWESGAKYGTLEEFSKGTQGKEYVANEGNTAWFRYKWEGGENCIVECKLNPNRW